MTRRKIIGAGIGIVVILVVIIIAIVLFKTSSSSVTPAEVPPSSNAPAALTKVYDNKDSRYSIKYPEDWEYDVPGQGTVVFNGKKGTPAFYSTVNIQTVLTKSTGGDYSTVNEFISDIKNQALKQFADAKFIDNGPVTLPSPQGQDLKGEFITFTYSYNNIPFKQWQIVLLRNDNQVFYAWAYTSPVDQYENDLATAKEMFKSWVIY